MAGGPGAYLFGEEERKEVMEVLETGYLFRYGEADDPRFKRKVDTFEKEFAGQMGAEYCVATSSGTGALLCCLAALGIGAGDEVIVPGYTFIASISSIVLMNAIPVLAEVDSSLTLDPRDVKKKITPKTKAIMAVHMLGNPCDMDALTAIARENKLYIIEDCCQSVGARYKGCAVGTIGDMGAFSLNVFKTITAGDGGAVITKDFGLYERAFGFHDQGHKPSRLGVEMGRRNIIGMNLRMNELTGAVALAQLRKLPEMLDALREKKGKLKGMLTGLPGVGFRKINDPGECATLLTLLFDTRDGAEEFSEKLGTKPMSCSGWHVYSNMEQIIGKKTLTEFNCPYGCPVYGKNVTYEKHMLPQTDTLLERAVNISVGVVDKGLGAGAGINVLSGDAEIERIGSMLRETILSLR